MRWHRISVSHADGPPFHQENFCQATGKPPEAKYEKDGGPGMAQIQGILDRGTAPERDSNLFALSQLNKTRQLQPQKVKMAMAVRTGSRPHYRWNEIQPHHFKALAESLSDPKLWSMMLDTARAAPEAIASVSKRLPPDLKESVWTCVTEGFARKAGQFFQAANMCDRTSYGV